MIFPLEDEMTFSMSFYEELGYYVVLKEEMAIRRLKMRNIVKYPVILFINDYKI